MIEMQSLDINPRVNIRADVSVGLLDRNKRCYKSWYPTQRYGASLRVSQGYIYSEPRHFAPFRTAAWDRLFHLNLASS